MEVLPDDLVRECLLRVPYQSHHNLRAVCTSWEAMLSNPKFYEDRKRSGTSEQIICLIQHDGVIDYVVTVYDPAKGTWERLPPINDPRCHRMPFFCECVSVNRRLILIGGQVDGMLLKSVYIYDFESAKWSRGADMSIARHRFAFSVSPSTGLIYVAGGRNDNGDSVRVAEVYDVEKDRWDILPPMIRERGRGCLGVFIDDAFIVLGGGQINQFDASAEVLDPSAGTWTLRQDMWTFLDSAVVISYFGRDLYVFSEEEVMKYDPEKNNWSAVASLQQDIPYLISATHWRDWIFVTGWHPAMKQLYLMFNPSTGQSIEVKCDGGNNHVFCATTVEI